MNNILQQRFLSIGRYAAYCLLVMIFILGSAVIVGWLTHNTFIIQVSADYVPMQFNAALSFVLIALAMLCVETRNKSLAVAISILLIFSSTIVLFEYIFSFDTGLSELFVKHYVAIESASPGRMAPNTALGFLIIGMSTLWLSTGRYTSKKAILLIFMNFSVFILSYTSFIGYCFGSSTINRWGLTTNMAWHTALGFMAWGIACITLLLIEIKERGYRQKVYYTVLSFLLGSFFFTILWQVAIVHEADVFKQSLANTSSEMVERFNGKLTTEFYALIRLAKRNAVKLQGHWKEDVNLYLKHHDSIDLIAKVNPDHTLSEPYVKADTALSLYNLQNVLFQVNIGQQPISLVPIRVDGISYLCAFFQMGNAHLLALYNINSLAQSVLSKTIYKEYNIEIRLNDNRVLLHEIEQALSLKAQWGHMSHLRLYNTDFQFFIWPSWITLDRYKSFTPSIILISGLILSLAISLLVFQKQVLLSQNAALAALNDELENFSYSIAHNLKAPLRHISGYIHLMDRDIQKKDETHIQKYMAIITKSSEKMDQLIDALLKYSALSQAKLKKGVIPLNTLIDQVIRMLPDEKASKVEWSIPLLPNLFADEKMMKALFQELLTNAIRFSQDKKQLKITIQANETKQGIEIFVKDNGIGMNAEYGEKAFLLFHQLESSSLSGIGSGLAYVKKIVERHDGVIYVESELNQGTVIHMFFPKLNE